MEFRITIIPETVQFLSGIEIQRRKSPYETTQEEIIAFIRIHWGEPDGLKACGSISSLSVGYKIMEQ